MKCVQVTAIGKDFNEAMSYLSWKTNVAIPEPRKNQVVVKVKVASLNFLDTLVIQNKYQVKFPVPFTPGTEYSGVVVKVGSGVKNFSVGDRVLGAPDYPYGTFGEYTVSSPVYLWKMPSNMSFADGASFATIYGTAYMALIQRAKLLSHRNAKSNCNNLLVTAGAGGLGTACIQIANCFKKGSIERLGSFGSTASDAAGFGAVGSNIGLHTLSSVNKIVACVGNTQFQEKERIVKACGADRVINYSLEPEWGKKLKKEKMKFDIICDMVGGDAFKQGMKCINNFGKLVVLGFAGGQIPTVKVNKLLLTSCDVIGCAWGATSMVDLSMFRDSIDKSLKLYEIGMLKPVIGNVYGFSEMGIKTALYDLANRKSIGKLLINVNDDSIDNKSSRVSSKL